MNEKTIPETSQFLTFYLADEVYAVDILRIKEVLEYTEMTKIPRTPEFMSGVINLRGTVVPVIDMRLKFGMPKTERTVDACIIIIEVRMGDRITILGAIADSVNEVMNLEPDQVEPPPRIGAKLKTGFIRGMGKQGDQFVIILDTDEVFTSEELSLLKDAGNGVD